MVNPNIARGKGRVKGNLIVVLPDVLVLIRLHVQDLHLVVNKQDPALQQDPGPDLGQGRNP
jgi:hypothetical protein